MVIETRWRDIPFDEVVKCIPTLDRTRDRRDWESLRRGRPLRIVTPAAFSAEVEGFVCKGPFFVVPGTDGIIPGTYGCVCPHTAEIGD